MDFRCPDSCKCGTACSVADSLAGCIIACPNSGEPIRVPARPFREADWLGGTDPQAMLLRLPAAVPDRKLRLFALACCRRVEARLTHPLSRRALALAERYADGLATDEDMGALASQFMGEYNARLAGSSVWYWNAAKTTDLNAAYAMTRAVFPARAALAAVEAARDKSKERSIQCQLLRCILGNPFRPPPALEPRLLAWQRGTVVHLAEAIYQERRWKDMPVLGDVLEEAGCRDEDMLQHCRQQGGVHARGCWLIDLLLGKP
jgi:hypothetical protein